MGNFFSICFQRLPLLGRLLGRSFSFMACGAILFTGCSRYQMGVPKRLEGLCIRSVVDASGTPGLQPLLAEALRRSSLRKGVRVRAGALWQLSVRVEEAPSYAQAYESADSRRTALLRYRVQARIQLLYVPTGQFYLQEYPVEAAVSIGGVAEGSTSLYESVPLLAQRLSQNIYQTVEQVW